MKKINRILPLLLALCTFTSVFAASPATISPARYLHVKVDTINTHELVRINVPLSLAEKIIPAINHEELRNGKIKIGKFSANLDLKAILNALKSAPESEFVTVREPDNDVRVAKEDGRLVVHVVGIKSKEKVDVTVPWEVAEALILDTTDDQLNVQAAIRALKNVGDLTLIQVTDHNETVTRVD